MIYLINNILFNLILIYSVTYISVSFQTETLFINHLTFIWVDRYLTNIVVKTPCFWLVKKSRDYLRTKHKTAKTMATFIIVCVFVACRYDKSAYEEWNLYSYWKGHDNFWFYNTDKLIEIRNHAWWPRLYVELKVLFPMYSLPWTT